MGDAQPPLEQVSPPKNYCNVTFLSIGDLGPNGLLIERLLRCARCKETYYCGKEQQRSHWKLHQFVCRPAHVEAPEESFAGLSMGTVAEAITLALDHLWDGVSTRTLVENANVVRAFLFLLKRLQILYDEDEITETDVASADSMIQGMWSLFDKSDQSIELLWAIPGVTTFLLNLELMSMTMRERKLAAAVPSDDELRHPQAMQLSRSFCIFTNAVCRFIEACFVVIKADQLAHYRENAIAACAARKMMQLYADPYTRGSFPLGQSVTPRLRNFPAAYSFLLDCLPDDPWDTKALVPGLTVHEVFQIIITEPEWYDDMGRTRAAVAFKQLLLSASTKLEAWEAFTVEARAIVANKLLGLYRQLDTNNEEYARNDAEALTRLFFIAVGYNFLTNTKDDALWLKVVEHAATPDVGPFAGVFSEWYKRVGTSACKELIALTNDANFSMDLIPSPVVNHILEYAMDPFCHESQLMGTVPLLMAYEGTSSPFVDEFLELTVSGRRR
jgi:MYND finger